MVSALERIQPTVLVSGSPAHPGVEYFLINGFPLTKIGSSGQSAYGGTQRLRRCAHGVAGCRARSATAVAHITSQVRTGCGCRNFGHRTSGFDHFTINLFRASCWLVVG